MEEDKKKKFQLKRVDVLLLILLVLVIWLAIGAVNFGKKTAEAEQQFDYADSERRANEEYEQAHRDQQNTQVRVVTDYEDQFDPYDRKEWDGEDTRVIASEIPENLAGRGIILLGKTEEDGRTTYRESTDGTRGWWNDYCADCNLIVETNAMEFVDFVKRLDENCVFSQPRDGYPAYYSATINYNNHPFVIYRSDSVRWDLSEGTVYYDGDPGCDQPAFYDPSGKYITVSIYDYSHEEMLRKFLEPAMVKLSVTKNTAEGNTESFEDTETIDQYIDALHELECCELEQDASDLLSGGNVVLISFTAENGRIHDYYFVDGNYIIYNDQVYSAGNSEKLSGLLE